MAKGENITIEEIMEQARLYLSEDDVAFIRRAYEFAERAHGEQYRKSGEPYIIHPVQVAGILVELEMDPETIAGGDRKSTRLNSSHVAISYAVFCLKKKTTK